MNKLDDKKINIITNLLRTLKYIRTVEKRYLLITVIFTFIVSIIPAISLVVMQNIINLLQSKINEMTIVFQWICVYVCIDLLDTLLKATYGYYNSKFSLKFNLVVKQIILEKASSLNLKDYENSEIYDMIKRAEYESEGNLLSYFSKFVSVVSLLVTISSYFLILLKFKAWIVIIVMIVPILKYLVSNKINIEQFKILKKRTDDERKAWYYRFIVTNGDNYKELKIYNLFKYFYEKHKEYINKFNIQDLRIARKRLLYLTTFDIFEQIINGIVFLYIVYYGYLGSILIGDVVTYTRTVISTKSQIQGILEVFADIRKESLFINLFFDFLDLHKHQIYLPDKTYIVKEIEEIKVEKLFYKYRADQEYILKNVNFTIKKGEMVAILGRNGSGKTTLAKILLGFYDDYEGNVYVNGINIKQIDKASYMAKVGVLFQDFARFEATFRENVAYGNLEIMNLDNKILEISDKFQISGSINQDRSKCLDTQLGYWFDSGKQISIGQWQKVALSRAFAKDADMYFLDEPNAALDSISEYDLSNLYSGLLQSKIGVIIAHRFNNFIKQASKIVVMDEGEIVESGTHKSLLKSGKLYKKLYDLQTGDF